MGGSCFRLIIECHLERYVVDLEVGELYTLYFRVYVCH